MPTYWIQLCKRTNDPKLAFIEHSLAQLDIPSRRHGESFHAPILEVPVDQQARAWRVLAEPAPRWFADVPEVSLDDLPDDHPAVVRWWHQQGRP